MSQPNPDRNPTKDKPAVREPDRSPEQFGGDGKGGLTIAPKLPTDAGKPRKSGAI